MKRFGLSWEDAQSPWKLRLREHPAYVVFAVKPMCVCSAESAKCRWHDAAVGDTDMKVGRCVVGTKNAGRVQRWVCYECGVAAGLSPSNILLALSYYCYHHDYYC